MIVMEGPISRQLSAYQPSVSSHQSESGCPETLWAAQRKSTGLSDVRVI